jgi:hypothetical protein
MRQKLYYTVDEITTNLYTSGSEWMFEDNTEYVGLYHRYITNEVYTGETWNAKLSQKLVPYKNINATNVIYNSLKRLNINFKEPYAVIVSPTADDMKRGSFSRYFFKKINDSQITEIDKTQFELYPDKIDPVMYDAIYIDWEISGELTDTYINGVFNRGVITKNRLTTIAAEQRLPGMITVLTNYSEFYLNTDITTPKDINA